MWCPSVSLSLWANAWLAGKAAPDDVLDALSVWAPKQSVTAYDAVAAGHTGLPWPDVNDAGTVTLLQTLRAAVGRPTSTRGAPPLMRGTINVVLPVPGDVRGLAPGTQFERDALSAGEAIIIANPHTPATAVGLVPEFSYQDDDTPDDYETGLAELCTLTWTVYSLPGAPILDHYELGDAEYTLRSAVRSAADALGTIGLGSAAADVDDPRGLVEQLLESARQHRIPDHAPSRALRVLENAAHVDAIIAVSAGLSRSDSPDRFAAPIAAGLEPLGTQSSSEARIASDALRPLTAVVRSARMAAVTAILHSAWAD
ncbi:hypothetical protein [Mycobacterium intracellulare]|uniref:Uncharacterized protein n=1 Tax=Mycobacterium intracellulare subsp. chimaera TaxID=222805 RepID=A0A7U5MLV7_MYCIT|nr:hypothetical protein [Mycobacterium intracellulare]ASL15938.1 hypothetical protein MYCOZU2_03556 [Mycobacterium intracellulare subsp. chimaera]ASQ87070.1 hypothetical protein CE197_16855 [Mycobacterium intracellulare subsp. chimaera]MCF1812553.1 hypothetical protein [Mycobacterium intracellulare subsp. intracellulare]MDM3927044.1 hypothetical protein [Mycobacterium intracellulare subsp. chimaera]MDS0335092.1 hypothetical protein [Mycobacterium intracellulare]